jgi:hypothetical protein
MQRVLSHKTTCQCKRVLKHISGCKPTLNLTCDLGKIANKNITKREKLEMGWRQDKVDRTRKQTETKIKNHNDNFSEYLLHNQTK